MSSVSVHRVFRKEAIDSTHLPEFHQIEGIIHGAGSEPPNAYYYIENVL